MARPKEFDQDEALDAAIGVFREHGYAGTSAAMLTQAMQIGRQSLYDTFGDKWRLYGAAVQRYAQSETRKHIDMLQGGVTAWDGIERMMVRVVQEAHQPCLGVGSISEFGGRQQELATLRAPVSAALRKTLVARIAAAQADGAVAAQLDPQGAAAFLSANVAAIRLAARGGASDGELQGLAALALRALT